MTQQPTETSQSLYAKVVACLSAIWSAPFALLDGLRKALTSVILFTATVLLALLVGTVVYRQFQRTTIHIPPFVAQAGCDATQNATIASLGKDLVSEVLRVTALVRGSAADDLDIRYDVPVPAFKIGEFPVLLSEGLNYLQESLPFSGSRKASAVLACGDKCTNCELRLVVPGSEPIIARLDDPASLEQRQRLVRTLATSVLQAEYPCTYCEYPLVTWTRPSETKAEVVLAPAELAAIRCLTRARTDDERARALTSWSRLLDRYGFLAEASAVLARMPAAAEGVDSDLKQADVLIRRKEYEAAIAMLAKAEMKPGQDRESRAKVAHLRGLLSYAREDFASARAHYEQAALHLGDSSSGDDPLVELHAQIELNLANAYRDQASCDGDLAMLHTALDHYREAIRLDPKAAYAHNGLGRTYAELAKTKDGDASEQDWRNARREYLLAISLDPSFWEADNNAAIAYAALGDFERALFHHEQAGLDNSDTVFVDIDMAKTLIWRAADARRRQDELGRNPDEDFGKIVQDSIAAARDAIERAGKKDSGNLYLTEARAQLAELTGDAAAGGRLFEELSVAMAKCDRSRNVRAWKEKATALKASNTPAEESAAK